MRRDQIHLWMPGIAEGQGGIQSFGRTLLLTLHSLEWFPRLRVFLRNDRQQDIPEILRHSGRVCSFGWLATPLRLLTFISVILFEFCRCRPRLIIVGHPHFVPLADILKRIFGIRYWVVVYGEEVWELSDCPVLGGLRNAELIISVSETTESRLAAQIPEIHDRIRILPCTCDFDFFSPAPHDVEFRKRNGISEDALVLLTVARLDASQAYKGYDRVIEILPQLLKRVERDLKYVIVGSGSDQKRTEALIHRHGITDQVILTGRVPQDTLLEWYRQATLFIMPSVGEGFGIVFLEALGCDKPVVGGNRDGSVDALRGGELGSLVDPFDQSQLLAVVAEKLHESIHSPPAPGVLRSRVIRHFGADAFTSALVEILQKVPES